MNVLRLNTGLRTPSFCSSASKNSESETQHQKQHLPSYTEVEKLSAGLASDDKARLAVVNAFTYSPEQLLSKYLVRRIIGFGSNGVVLAALLNMQTPVAIKIIYKRKQRHSKPCPDVEALKHLNALNCPGALKYIDDWQDAFHFYLVTELFGSDWLASSPVISNTAPLFPVTFTTPNHRIANGAAEANTMISLPFFAGSCDLWAWAVLHRTHAWESSGHNHSLLPIVPIKEIIKQTASALAGMHSRGFYHGDVKLENILIQSIGGGVAIRLADFGHTQHISLGFDKYGTREISPPEMLWDSPYKMQELDGRCIDVFALGMMLYRLLNQSGKLPRAAKSVNAGMVGYHDLLKINGGLYPFGGLDDTDVEDLLMLNSMCMVDPNQRITMEQIEKSSWLQNIC
ncbi:Calcium-dependent protein kinase 4 [Physocladia obscura]|uniref:Calcium-dependent protein kinase 4 n=1 Tax=Physocladia obscura TaxID=109957 RepID=A0AAD5XC10_9FUNG|nr:Calcium-dependent protein kinase 4 [Physocladia obscura]